MTSRCLPVGQRDASVGGHAGDGRDTGHDLERDVSLDACLGLVGHDGADPGVAEEDPRHQPARTRQRDRVDRAGLDDLGGGVEVLAELRRPSSSWTTMTSAARSRRMALSVSSSGSPGPTPTKATRPGGPAGFLPARGRAARGQALARGAQDVRSPINWSAPSAIIRAARSRPSRSADVRVAAFGQSDLSFTVVPGNDADQMQCSVFQRSVCADRGRAARLERGEQGAFGGDGGPARRVVERREDLEEVGAVGPALDRQGALAGRGQHLPRIEDLRDRVQPLDPRQPRVGEHDRVELARRSPCAAGCRRCRGSAGRPDQGEAPAAAPSGAANRCRSRAPRGRSASLAGPHRASRGSSRGGTAASAMPSAGSVGRSFERVHGEVDLAGEHLLAQPADEDAGAADLGQVGLGDVALGGHADELDLMAGTGGERVGDDARLRHGHQAPPRSQSELHRTSSARITASGAFGSRSNSSRSASV